MSSVSIPRTGVFATSGAITGAGYSIFCGNVGMTAMGSGIGLVFLSLVTGGTVIGGTINGLELAFNGDASAIASGLGGAMGGAVAYLNIGGVGLVGSFGSIGLGMGGMMAAGGIFGLGVYALLSNWLKSEIKESPQAVNGCMEAKVLDKEAYVQALFEVMQLNPEWQERDVKYRFRELEFADEIEAIKDKLKQKTVFSIPRSNNSVRFYSIPTRDLNKVNTI